jgi:hypothetical protein
MYCGSLVYKVYKTKTTRSNFEEFMWLSDNIRSCGTFAELQTCSDWLDKMSYQMEPGGVSYLKELMGKKMEELERLLRPRRGEDESGIQ